MLARDGWRCVRCLSTSWLNHKPYGARHRVRECADCGYIDLLAQMQSNATTLIRKEAGP